MSDPVVKSEEAPTADLRRSAISGGAYLAGRHAISVVMKIVGVLVITRLLGPARYGSYVTAFNIYTYTLLIGQAGVGVYLVRHPGELPEKVYRTAYALLLIIGLTLCAALELLSLKVAWLTSVEGSGAVLAVLALALPFTLTTVSATARLERQLNYRAVAQVEITAQLIFYVIGVPLAFAGFGALSLACAWLFQEIASCFLAHRRANAVPSYRIDREVALEIFRYSASFSLASWVWQARMLVNPLVIGPLLGAHAVGIVGMTVGILELLSIAKTIAWRLSVAVLSKVQHDSAKLRKAVTEGMELQTLAVGAVLLGFGWVGGIAVPLVFGERWRPVMDLYPYVALSYLTIATFNVHSATVSILNRNSIQGLANIAHMVVFIGVTAFAAPRLGIIAYGLGELATLPTYIVLHLIVARAIGSPDYRITLLWWSAAAIGLFWRSIGWWAIAVPLIALALPPSLKRLRGYWSMLRRKAPVPAPAPAMP